MVNIKESTIKALIKDWVQNNEVFERGLERTVKFDLKGEVIVKQGEDYLQTIDHTVPYAELLTLALSKMNGVTVEALVKEFDKVQTDPSFKAEMGENKEKAKKAIRTLKGKAERNCKGKVTFDHIEVEGDIEDCSVC